MATAMFPRPQEVEDEDHWQVGKSLPECNLHMLEHSFSDVTFKIINRDEQGRLEEPVYIPALQTLLLARSPVFSSMFRGDLAQKTEQPVIDIHDIDPQAFREMLRFIYTDNVNLTADNVMAVLYASKKYIVTELTKRCAQFLEDKLSAETAPQMLDQCMLFDLKELKDTVLNKIAEEASKVLLSEDFTKLSKEALHEVLQLNLNITKELEVFEAAMTWAENKCQELKKSIEGANLRDILGDNFFLIRFPTMTGDELSDHVLPRDVLTPSETIQVFRFLTVKSKKTVDLPFCNEPRISKQQQHVTPADTPQQPVTPAAMKQQPTVPKVLQERLFMPPPYVNMEVKAHDPSGYNAVKRKHQSVLQCEISRPILLKRVLVSALTPGSQCSTKLAVRISKNGKSLKTTTNHHFVDALQVTPAHYVVDVADVKVEAGGVLIDITLKVERLKHLSYSFEAISPAITRLSDEFLTITFRPVQENLLLGIDYSPL